MPISRNCIFAVDSELRPTDGDKNPQQQYQQPARTHYALVAEANPQKNRQERPEPEAAQRRQNSPEPTLPPECGRSGRFLTPVTRWSCMSCSGIDDSHLEPFDHLLPVH